MHFHCLLTPSVPWLWAKNWPPHCWKSVIFQIWPFLGLSLKVEAWKLAWSQRMPAAFLQWCQMQLWALMPMPAGTYLGIFGPFFAKKSFFPPNFQLRANFPPGRLGRIAPKMSKSGRGILSSIQRWNRIENISLGFKNNPFWSKFKIISEQNPAHPRMAQVPQMPLGRHWEFFPSPLAGGQPRLPTGRPGQDWPSAPPSWCVGTFCP